MKNETPDEPAIEPATDLLITRRGIPRRLLHLGNWTLDLRGNELADLRYGDCDLLRAVRPVARDRDWNTLAGTVTTLVHEPDRLQLGLAFTAGGSRRTDEADFTGQLVLTYTPDELHIEFAATAVHNIACNRVGLVVLHHPDVAGTAVTVRHIDAADESSTWPDDISPHQPFKNVTGFGWRAGGLQIDLHLSGDVFETEDQRNWTDASFKTYSTPLDRPFPVVYSPGDHIHQSATLHVTAADDEGTAADSKRDRSTTTEPAPGAETASGADRRRRTNSGSDRVVLTDVAGGRVPALGLQASLFPPPRGPLPVPKRRYDTVLLELAGDPVHWAAALRVAGDQAADLECGLDVRLVTDDPDLLAGTIAALPTVVTRASVFDPKRHLTTPPLWQALTAAAQRDRHDLECVAGTRAHFTELNRGVGDLPRNAAAYTFSITPQMHATEIDHILDSLTMQPVVAASASRLVSGRPLHIGPITFARRFNNVATSEPLSPEDLARRAIDPLLHTEFAATWTLASVAALSHPAVASLCYYEVAGPRGLVDAERFGSQLSPVGRTLDVIAQWRGRSTLHVDAPSDLAVLAVDGTAGQPRVMVGNLSDQQRTVRLVYPDDSERELDLAAWASASVGGDESVIR